MKYTFFLIIFFFCFLIIFQNQKGKNEWIIMPGGEFIRGKILFKFVFIVFVFELKVLKEKAGQGQSQKDHQNTSNGTENKTKCSYIKQTNTVYREKLKKLKTLSTDSIVTITKKLYITANK